MFFSQHFARPGNSQRSIFPPTGACRVQSGERQSHRLPFSHWQVHIHAGGDVERASLEDKCARSLTQRISECAIEGRRQRGVRHELHVVKSRCEDVGVARSLHVLLHEAPQNPLGLEIRGQQRHASGVRVRNQGHLHGPGQPPEKFERLLLLYLLLDLVPRQRPQTGGGTCSQDRCQLVSQRLHLGQRLYELPAEQHHAGVVPRGVASLDHLLQPAHRLLQRPGLGLPHREGTPCSQGHFHRQRVLATADEVPILL
mmetsp:Transcript_98375/g.317223  ORF Transcript_98375/g.317223 Transcript_98375/m.317223 type:complete len:256 (+) Transcript_98375:2494-3261(+)